MTIKGKPLTIRQECAAYIIAHPGSRVNEMQGGIRRLNLVAGTKSFLRALKEMTDSGEIRRVGARKLYRYFPGQFIDRAVAGLAVPRKVNPRTKRCSDADDGVGVMTIRQVWLSQGDYVIDTRNMHARSIFDWAAR
jgi:hypothetical protein